MGVVGGGIARENVGVPQGPFPLAHSFGREGFDGVNVVDYIREERVVNVDGHVGLLPRWPAFGEDVGGDEDTAGEQGTAVEEQHHKGEEDGGQGTAHGEKEAEGQGSRGAGEQRGRGAEGQGRKRISE